MKKLILIGFLLFIVGCGDNKSGEKVVTQESEILEVKNENMIDKSANVIKNGIDSVAKNANILKDKIGEVAENSSKKTNEIIDESKQMASETINKVTQKVNEITSPNGKALFTSCISCHGQNGEKKALNVSNIIAGQAKEELINKLNGYKNGTYGGNMKNVMASQAKTLDNEKIEALAKYISTLK